MFKFKKYFHEIIKVKKSPKSIAFGAALGTFISILPTPFMNVLIGIVVILLFKNTNKFSLFGSMAFWNPITLIPIYIASYKIGNFLLKDSVVIEYEFTLLEQVFQFTRRFLIGNLMIAIFVSTIVFVIIYYISLNLQQKNESLF